MDNDTEVAGIFSKWDGGACFKGVGDSECESHFTYVAGEGYHLSTYMNLDLVTGGDGSVGKELLDRKDF